ncbi:hypothetical protein [Sphingomonas japonica]|uniref:DNA-binding MarR family transcriptional regulator n=1 Tax=Sphingomonas japonica TaxID=511662 RepID=A0ABX0TZQ2_9SPHN|nr:hypothetical protein [Sphingomonas japonica]NIJ23713.1 DNA-binding MarR family transcriptional regulator [Sphingomonas japonica]
MSVPPALSSSASGPALTATLPDAILVTGDMARRDMLAATIAKGGVRVAALVEPDAVPDAAKSGAALVYLDLSSLGDAQLDAALAAVATITASGSAVIADFARAQLEHVVGDLFGSAAALLCDPGDGERIAAVALAVARRGPMLGERSRDASDERLQRLNDEVARIAETLARLTRGGEEGTGRRGGVADRSLGYAAEPAGVGGGKAAAIRAILRARRLRDQHLGNELFADPAWDMLLDLHAAAIEGAQVSVSSLCIAAAVPPTTALRWIQTLHERGLFERRQDPFDKRRAYIALSETGSAAMTAYFAALGEAAPKVV